MSKAIIFHGATVLAAVPTCKGYLPVQGSGVCRREGLADRQSCPA
ncbi:MAG: hypothetical protein R3B89_05105 [Polyangiaceae bacterium]